MSIVFGTDKAAACKKVGCPKNSAEDTECKLTLSVMAGTGYMCRVINGELSDANVYLYISTDGKAVTTYNGTTENVL